MMDRDRVEIAATRAFVGMEILYGEFTAKEFAEGVVRQMVAGRGIMCDVPNNKDTWQILIEFYWDNAKAEYDSMDEVADEFKQVPCIAALFV